MVSYIMPLLECTKENQCVMHLYNNSVCGLSEVSLLHSDEVHVYQTRPDLRRDLPNPTEIWTEVVHLKRLWHLDKCTL